MGNSWKGLSEEKFQEYEKRLLIYSGIPYGNFDIKNIPIDDQGNYIRTIRVGDTSKETFVLVHGYGGSGVMYWKTMKLISEKFNLYLIDILGMGGSSRPKFKLKTQQETD